LAVASWSSLDDLDNVSHAGSITSIHWLLARTNFWYARRQLSWSRT
jgi:hypothetical protein